MALVDESASSVRGGYRTHAELEAEVQRLRRELDQMRVQSQVQEAFLRNVIDTVPGFVCVKELGGKFTLANRELAEAYGTTSEAIVGKTDADFNKDPEEVASFLEDDRQVILHRMPRTIAAEKFTTGGGKERWLQTIKVPLVAADGSCTQLLAVAADITDLRRLEQDLHQAQKLQAIGQLAGGIAHDFNNVLTAIIGNTEMLRMDLPRTATTLREHCDAVLHAAEIAARLTRELLAFSRKAPMMLSTTDINEVVGHVVHLLQHTLDRRITIVNELEAGPVYALADASLIQNALLNLALNGGDAMPDGGTLTFSTATSQLHLDDCADPNWELRPGLYVQISVSDTGTGMTTEVKERIFDPFFTTKPVGKGTGLGLPSVYGTIRSHRGKMKVESKPGQGSTFKLYLPAPSLSQAVEVKRIAPAPVVGTGKILWIDDEPSVITAGIRMLRKNGYHVESVADGYVGLSLYSEGSFDLVILDMMMPVADGSLVFERLQQQDPNVRILIASGFASDGRVQKMLTDGARGFLQKPYRAEELRRAVAAALADERTR